MSMLSGEWIRASRADRGWHQHELAAMIGPYLGKKAINQGRVSEWENEVKPVSPLMAAILLDLLSKE